VADFYEGGDPSAASNSYFWTAGFPGGGYGANSGGGMPLPANNPFTPQDFGGSSSDGFDMQRQQQMAAYQGGQMTFILLTISQQGSSQFRKAICLLKP
jgi:hypothetical protein